MTSERVLELLADIRIVPVIVIDDDAFASEVAAALSVGGIRCAEITLRTPAGLRAIEAVAGAEDFVVGAGTVLTAEQVDQCVDAGAEFIVSPGFDDEVVERAQHHGIAVLPGVATATEIQRAIRAGLDAVKFFPADRLGGLETIRSLAAPFPGLRFVPSGGVTAGNALEYLAHPAILAVSGSWMATRDLIRAGDFTTIERLSNEASALVAGIPS
ncbi:MAG TPA: keto-deoxy-phosphogluconate aldolase [Microbacteriaceae bacterium]|jgi:2-dehydro-3-deoxyphosphogluconate aldolase/(4S)-4-hydroxy-2-oxoglutarate aldolase|nr:keto-deoxy-phosphogluconate aldolase [Microbacteriaceae bacterium]